MWQFRRLWTEKPNMPVTPEPSASTPRQHYLALLCSSTSAISRPALGNGCLYIDSFGGNNSETRSIFYLRSDAFCSLNGTAGTTLRTTLWAEVLLSCPAHRGHGISTSRIFRGCSSNTSPLKRLAECTRQPDSCFLEYQLGGKGCWSEVYHGTGLQVCT